MNTKCDTFENYVVEFPDPKYVYLNTKIVVPSDLEAEILKIYLYVFQNGGYKLQDGRRKSWFLSKVES